MLDDGEIGMIIEIITSSEPLRVCPPLPSSAHGHSTKNLICLSRCINIWRTSRPSHRRFLQECAHPPWVSYGGGCWLSCAIRNVRAGRRKHTPSLTASEREESKWVRSWPASRWQWFDFAPRRGACCPCRHTIGGAGRSPGSTSSSRRWRWRRRRSAGLSLLVAAAALPCTTVRRRHYHCRRWLTAGSCAARVLLAPPPSPFRRPPRDPH